MIFDFDKRTIILFNKDIYYEEKIKKQSLNQFDYENFNRSIPLNNISYHFLYRNIGQHVKFELKRKITEIQNFIEKIPKEESFKELHNEMWDFPFVYFSVLNLFWPEVCIQTDAQN